MKNIPFSRHLIWIAVPVVAALLFLWSHAAGDNPAPAFPHASLTIARADGTSWPLAIEVASTPEQETYGLMFRRGLPENSGMLFLWTPPQPVSMWMKNTLIPLDMLFVDSGGVIVKIAANAEPMNLTPIPAGQPVKAVIEIEWRGRRASRPDARRQGAVPGL